ncbi:hypothetical protein [Pseudonocardia sp.]|jgi:hypothetical protein|uniref:hypothetical protein n=1 Tax=Pseudonocardia sp. TaxID=60912 RepID=UPI0026392B68|nr:hypothetical protein [Pseudonocardia sp.]MCW2718162.1 hypothetical protein [Pseudonocardia sp.]
MPSAGVLILFAIVGSAICAKSRFAGGAIFFGVVTVVLFISTPMGAGLPGALSTFLSTFDHAATPVLNGTAAG